MTLPTRRLGSTGLYPTALGLGGAWLGARSESEAEAVEAVHRAFAHGINFFDTDPGYRQGKSEPRLGKALAGLPRDEVIVSTKVGTAPEMRGDFRDEAVRASFEGSLKSLGVDYVDLLLIHDPPDIEAALSGAMEPMLRLKERGLARYIGIGCRQHAFHLRAMATGEMDVVLTFQDYTLLSQSALVDTIPEAMRRGVGLILGSPLGMGRLSGVEPDEAKFPHAHAMWRWCGERGVNVRHLAMQFCLSLPIEGSVLVGAATAGEVDEAVAALAPIDEQVWRDFEAAFGVRRCVDVEEIVGASS